MSTAASAVEAVPAEALAAAETPPPGRIRQLDTVRGIAVMGILAMNIVAFAMPFSAYMNPEAYGLESNADLASWVFSFIFIDGKMRGLFSFLFGASTLLVIERAGAAGLSPARVHYARMLWLLVFGLIHFYFIWFGDILALYAQTGLVLFFFRNLSVRALLRWGIGLVLLQTLLFAAIAGWAYYLSTLPICRPSRPKPGARCRKASCVPTGQALADELALYRGSYAGLVHERLVEHLAKPFTGTPLFLAETLGYMLLGMAALKSGFFRGTWPIERYRKWAMTCLGIGIPVYAMLAYLSVTQGFRAGEPFPLFDRRHYRLPPGHGGRHRRPDHRPDPQWRPPGRADRRGGARRLHQLSRHLDPDDDPLLRLRARPLRLAEPDRALDPGGRHVGADAALVEALARPLPLRPVRMAVAQPLPDAASSRCGGAPATPSRSSSRAAGWRERGFRAAPRGRW